MGYDLEPIGVIRTARAVVDDTPVQSVLNWAETGEVRLDPHYAPALAELEGFTHLWLLTWLHRPGQPLGDGVGLRQVPYLLGPGGAAKGIFATRGPRRPNPIGLHLVHLLEVTDDPPIIRFAGVDVVDGTEVLDVKPWVSRFDEPPPGDERRSGWFDDVAIVHGTPAELRADRHGPRSAADDD